MHLLGKRTFAFANTGYKAFRERYASSSSWQYTETLQLKPSATMGQDSHEKPLDLSTWTADQLIARVTFLEQRLKEQTAKFVSAFIPRRIVLIV